MTTITASARRYGQKPMHTWAGGPDLRNTPSLYVYGLRLNTFKINKKYT